MREKSLIRNRAAKASGALSFPGRMLQRKCACGGSSASGECEECKKKEVQRKTAAAGGPAVAPPIVHEVLNSPGQPLDAQTRSYFEPRFGHDFSKVRVHTDATAAESTQAVNAIAYTVGRDIVFDAGRYRPETKEGSTLLAHELTHVAQQGQASTSSLGDLNVAPPDDALEREAEKSGRDLNIAHTPARKPRALQRVPKDPSTDLGKGSTLPYRQANALSDCIAIMGEKSRDYCWQQIKDADPSQLQPLSPYRRALFQIRTLDPLLFGFLSKADLTGPSTPVLTKTAVDTSVSPPVTIQLVFNLQVQEVALPPGLDADFDGGIPQITDQGTSKTFTANMQMKVNSKSSTDLAQNLFHEGVHMLIFMDKFLPTSPHGAALANYKKIAKAHADFVSVRDQLKTLIETGLKSQKVDPAGAQKQAIDLLDDVLEEKYVRDQEGAKFNATFSNKALAATQIIKDLGDLKITVPLSDAAMQSIVQKTAGIMDAIDQQVKAAAAPAAAKPTKKQP